MKMLFTYILILLISLSGCDTCDIEGPDGGNNSEKIYYTAISANQDMPYIYSMNKSLAIAEELIKNAILYSAPSNNGFLCYISKSTNQENELYTYNLNDASRNLITRESPIFNINSPVISSNGAKIAFNAGEHKFIIFNNDKSNTFNLVSTTLKDASSYSFSPDSKLLAYLESVSDSQVKIKIIDAINLDQINVLYELFMDLNSISNDFGDLFSWNKLSDRLLFSVNQADSSFIMILDINTKIIRTIGFSSADIKFKQAAISPDGKFVSFVNIDGNVWVISISDNNYRFSKITNFNGINVASLPKWNSVGNQILFSINGGEDNPTFSTLLIANIEFNENLVQTKSINIVSNNVYRGFLK